MGDNETYLDGIDDILNADDREETPTDVPEGEKKESQKPDAKGKKSVSIDTYKNLQEHARQQDEKIAELEKQNKKIGDLYERITGNPEEDKKKIEEIEERKRFEKDTPNATRELINQAKEEIKQEIEEQRSKDFVEESKQRIKKAYASIYEDTGIDVKDKKVQSKILPFVNAFTAEEKQANPKKVIEYALKLSGELDKQGVNMNFVEKGSVGAPNFKKKKENEEEAEAHKKRIRDHFKTEQETIF
jgi:hypothetical protein